MYRMIPHIFLTWFLGSVANSKIVFLKNFLIKLFIKFYKPDLNEVRIPELSFYDSYNAFFIRKLKKESRPIDHSECSFVSPVDGEIVDYGAINETNLIQAKKYDYPIAELIGMEWEDTYSNGFFITIYLAPTDYHRIHCPYEGLIKQTKHMGSYLYSVNKKAQETIPNLYIKNERSVIHFESQKLKYALVSVGASIVGSIVPFWSEEKDSRKSLINDWNQGPGENYLIKKGQELAHFKMGSTVILLLENQQVIDLDSLKENKLVKFGSKLFSIQI